MCKKCHFDIRNVKNLPTAGGGDTPPHTRSTRAVASLPRFASPLLKNPGYASEYNVMDEFTLLRVCNN